MSLATPVADERAPEEGPAMALLEEKVGVVEKTGWEPDVVSRFSQVTEVKVSSSASIGVNEVTCSLLLCGRR